MPPSPDRPRAIALDEAACSPHPPAATPHRASVREALIQPGITRLDGLRVAVVNWRDPWQESAGGAEQYAWQMSRGLRARGARVHFVTSLRPGQPRREEREGIVLARMGGTYSLYPLALGWLLRHRRDFDVVIDCMNGIPFFSPLAVSRGTRVFLLVHHVHGHQFSIYFRPLLAWVGRVIEGPVARLLYRRHPTVAISPSTAVAMRDRLRWTGPIFIVPNGTPMPAPITPPSPAGRSGEPGTGNPRLVCVGRLVIHKRVDLVIAAAARLRERWPGLVLHIVGRGPEHAALTALITRLNLRGTVFLHGFLPDADKHALLTGADLHLSASEFEGWGLSVIEAAALGVPTVAYDVDGLREAVRDGETGWLAVRGEQLADVVERALKELSDPQRRATVQQACTRWAGTFSWASSAERLARLIRAEPVTRRGGAAYVACYTDGPECKSVIVENTDPVSLHRLLLRSLADGGEVRTIRPATPTELLTGRPGTGP